MQGIVSIFGSDHHENTTTVAASRRRTLSADMSSERWMAENGLLFDQCDVNGNGNGNGNENNPARIDIWAAIMSEKAQDDPVKLPPPYVHPLVKKSGSSLSETSLKICTESLGSETGSDIFSSGPSSENGDENKTDEEYDDVSNEADEKEYNNNNNNFKIVRLECLTTKKAQRRRSFPPPLPSLVTACTDGPSLHMHSHRRDGRLVVEAVSVYQQKYFEAQRYDGRFLLTIIDNPNEQPPENNIDNVSDPKMEVMEEEEASVTPTFTPSLPPRSTGPPPPPVVDPVISQHRPPTKTKELGNKADCFMPSLKRCEEARRPILMWEPFCIATS